MCHETAIFESTVFYAGSQWPAASLKSNFVKRSENLLSQNQHDQRTMEHPG